MPHDLSLLCLSWVRLVEGGEWMARLMFFFYGGWWVLNCLPLQMAPDHQ